MPDTKKIRLSKVIQKQVLALILRSGLLKILYTKQLKNGQRKIEIFSFTSKNGLAKCILKGIEITAQNDSLAHIIPSALGGRLKPKGILCQLANTEMGQKFDNEFIECYRPFMTLVGGSKDKSGELSPVLATAKDGTKFKIFENKLEATQPEYIKTDFPDGTFNIQIKARTLKEARTLLGRVRTDFPDYQFDEEAILAQYRIEEFHPGVLEIPMEFGSRFTFPAIFGMGSLFSAYKLHPVHPQFVEYVEAFDVNKREMPPNTFYFSHDDPWVTVQAEVSHCLVLCSDVVRHKIIFFAQIFNQPGIAVIFPYSGDIDFCETYAVDILTGKPAVIFVNEKKLRSLDWFETHKNGDAELFTLIEKRSGPLIQRAQLKDLARAHQKIVEKASGGGNAIITTESKEEYFREMEIFLKRGLPEQLTETERTAALAEMMQEIRRRMESP